MLREQERKVDATLLLLRAGGEEGAGEQERSRNSSVCHLQSDGDNR